MLSGEALALALEKYDLWSRYVPEERGVLVAYASIHGNTAKAALELADMLRAQGLTVEAMDLARRDWAEGVAAHDMTSKSVPLFPFFIHRVPSVYQKNVDKYLTGADIVYGVRSSRKTDTFFKRTTAEAFYRMMDLLGAETVFNHADYRRSRPGWPSPPRCCRWPSGPRCRRS